MYHFTSKSYTFLDLFAGCGGLSEGFYREGFDAVAHLEIDRIACETLRRQMARHGYDHVNESVLCADIADPSALSMLEKLAARRTVDVVIGGPPCQSFSKLGRVRDPNNMEDDPRNYLFERYVEILNHFRPKLFVFENVTGILTQTIRGDRIIERILDRLGHHYLLLQNPDNMVLNAVHYGVPQERERIIIIGVRRDLSLKAEDLYADILKTHYDRKELPTEGLQKYISVRDAIGDLPKLKPGVGQSLMPYQPKSPSVYARSLHGTEGDIIRDHIARNHNIQDILRYTEMAKNRWSFLQMLDNRSDLGHKKRRVFFNSYKVQWWENPSKTIIAHLYKDGNQFIHPDWRQGRTLTVREVARLQSFPDNFEFAGSRTDQYKQIGNAVPPLMAAAIACSIRKNLDKITQNKKQCAIA